MSKTTFPYDLSIALIVKNEINYLKRCIETLQPLREAISCQLIITDTGSTDGTKEIAQEFADVYLEFDWCDDFAKARNTGVEVAQGRWFFFLDADNTLDDSVLEIASFVTSDHVDSKYDAASILIRNYTDTEENLAQFYDFPQAALVNFTKGKRYFRDAVHESIPVNLAYFTHVNTMLHHWGYLKQNSAQKENRNVPILKRMIEEDPHNYKARIQLAKELTVYQEKEDFLEESIELMAPLATNCHETQMWLSGLRTVYHHHAIQRQNWTLAERLIGQWEHYLPDTVVEVHFLGFCILSYLAQGERRQELLFTHFSAYQAAFLKEQQNHDPRYDMLDTFDYAKPEDFYKLELQTIHRAIQAGETQGAKEWLSASIGYSVEAEGGIHPYFFAYVDFCLPLEDYNTLWKLYGFSLQHSALEEKARLNQVLNQFFLSATPQQQSRILSTSQGLPIHSILASLAPQIPVEPQGTVSQLVPKLKETLLILLQAKQLEEAKKLFLTLEKIAPEDASIPQLRQLFSL